MPVFFVPANCIVPPNVSITGSLLRHVRDSLRLHVDETILIGDDMGRRYRVRIAAATKQELTGRILEPIEPPARATPTLALGQALLKGDKMDWVIQKATELGVRSIHPLQTRQSIVQPKAERVHNQVTRWQRIALEAAQQSEQWTVPTVAMPQLFTTYCSTGHKSLRMILTERRHGVASFDDVALPTTAEMSVELLVGPEGGWTQEEVTTAEQAGFRAITLGQTILRAETAAIAAVAILQQKLGALG